MAVELTANPILGIILHAGGAISAALCYTPQQKLKGWSWQTYWIVQASFCWVILPIVGAALTIPNIMQVLHNAPSKAMILTFALGAAYGIGGTCFGLAIKKIGYSLTYAIAIGISCILGTLAGPILKGELMSIMEKSGSGWVIAGIFIGLIGTLTCGLAGRMKELELQKNSTEEKQPFDLGAGLLLCGIAGILSAVYGIAVNDAGAPITKAAAEAGSGYWRTNIVYIFSNTGAFLTSGAYCVFLIVKEGTFSEFFKPKGDAKGALPLNYILAFLTGMMWYGQFLFYGTAHVRMGEFKFSSWGIHMIMLILFSAMSGVVMKEWHNRKHKTQFTITAAVTLLIMAVLMLAYGNYIGGSAPKKKSEKSAIEQKVLSLTDNVVKKKEGDIERPLQKTTISTKKIPPVKTDKTTIPVTETVK
jgi:L-rhamnose-H+ transport protein